MFNTMLKTVGGSVLAVTILAGAATVAAADAAALIDQAMNASHRSAAYKVRNQYRHPKETLLFFGVPI